MSVDSIDRSERIVAQFENAGVLATALPNIKQEKKISIIRTCVMISRLKCYNVQRLISPQKSF